MGAERVCREISILDEGSQAPSSVRENHHEALFDVFRKIERDLSSGDKDRAALLSARDVLVRMSASLPARSPREILFKLALWRWTATNMDGPLDELDIHKAAALSAFRDLAAMLSETSVLKEADRQG